MLHVLIICYIAVVVKAFWSPLQNKLVPLPRFERGRFLLLRETTLPICLQGLYSVMSLKEIVEKRNACSIPWIHTEVNLQTNEVKPCCKYRGVSGDLNLGLESVWNNPGYQQLRDDIARNQPHPACSACAVPDDVFSYKSFKNKNYMPRLHRIDIAKPALPEIIHITLKNT